MLFLGEEGGRGLSIQLTDFILILIFPILVHKILLEWGSDMWVERILLPILGDLRPSGVYILVLMFLVFPGRGSTIH